jgi:hypothetical protein
LIVLSCTLIICIRILVSPTRVQEEVIAKQNGLPEVESAVDGFPEPIAQEPDINSLGGEK